MPTNLAGCFMVLFYYPSFCHADYFDVDLISFPTRRSSDLHGERDQAHLGAARPRRHALYAVLLRRRRRPARDRKSTRLNSSHLVISYAVFCLKKKIGSKPITLKSNEVAILTASKHFRHVVT